MNKTTLKNSNKVQGLELFNFKAYYNTEVSLTVQYFHKDRYLDK